MSELSDETIVASVQRGDSHAFATLVQRYEAKMLRYAQKFLFEREDREDLVQEVFLKAYTNIRSFDTTRRFSPWLYRIAHNEYINAVAKKTRTPVMAFDFDLLFPHLPAKETADSETNRNDLLRELETHLGSLDPKYREPLILYYFEELNYQEIADVLHLPVATVGVRLSRGKNLLKKIIKDSGKSIV